MKREDFANGAAMKRILVAGGAGFLGSHLCELLVGQGHHVTCVDNLATGSLRNVKALTGSNRFVILKQDICDPLPEGFMVDEIYNLACAASPPHYQADPVGTMMTCVVGTNNLLALAERCDARFLQASTSEVYGDPEQHPQREDYWGHVNPTGPRACYDEGKRAAETLCFDYLRAGRADVRVVRIFNTYGPRMRPDDGRIISNLVCQALSGEPLTIYGTGEQTRSFCYVSDLVRGLVQMMGAKDNPGGPVNFGNPGEFTINELAELVLKITGSTSELTLHPLPVDDPQRRRPDISRARELFGWQPEIPLVEGLRPTIDWFAGETRKGGRAVPSGAHLARETAGRLPEPVAAQRH
ncbi:UDP-glucuronic acid decarboxylase family protein [Jiella sp. M17.18]|uniref:UDP-glucuronic acid decarboxylase family protein n=1 Tax=Jiella sp. M17.18 TaxID=3234247 RepID=UPI0034DEDEA5